MSSSKISAKIERLRRHVFVVISPYRSKSKLSLWFYRFIAALILCSVFLSFVQASAVDIPMWCQVMMSGADKCILGIFVCEYFLRLWTADLYFRSDTRRRRFERLRRMWKFIWTPLALVDLIAISPVLVALFPRGIQKMMKPDVFMVLRVFRIARLLRYAKRYEKVRANILAVLKEQRRELKVSLIAIGALMMVSSLLMYTAEHAKQPDDFKNAFSGLWWAVSTITTVGYGDLAPKTLFGRFCGIIIALAGVAAFAVPMAIINSGFVKRSITVKDIEKLLSEKDRQQDKELEKQRQMIDELKNRLVEFEVLLKEKVRQQDDGLAHQWQEMRRLSENMDRFSSKIDGDLSSIAKILMESDQRQMAVFSAEMNKFSTAVKNDLVCFEKRIEERQDEIKGFLVPAKKPDGALLKAIKRMASWLTPWKKSDCKTK